MYATQSTHKTLTSLRQGSMIHVFDQDWAHRAQETFHEAYMAHTSTSPNYQILASLDLGRRQVALEVLELVQKQVECAMSLAAGRDVVSATFVTPYPPGFPVLVPGQCFSAEILEFMSSLDTPEVHGYRPALGYRVLTDAALDAPAPPAGVEQAATNGAAPAATPAGD